MDKVKILWAEDDAYIRVEITEMMEEEGWEVIEATDGVEAFEKYKQCDPDLILLDVDMPRRSGLEVLQLIRLNDSHTPIVIYSTLHGDDDVMAGLVNGANVYLAKNFCVDNLLLQLKTLIPNKMAEVIVLAKDVSYNITTSELRIGEKFKTLSTLENNVFVVLCRNKNKLCRKDLLLDAGWKKTDRSVEQLLYKVIGELRQMLKSVESVKIVLNKGDGYCLKTT